MERIPESVVHFWIPRIGGRVGVVFVKSSFSWFVGQGSDRLFDVQKGSSKVVEGVKDVNPRCGEEAEMRHPVHSGHDAQDLLAGLDAISQDKDPRIERGVSLGNRDRRRCGLERYLRGNGIRAQAGEYRYLCLPTRQFVPPRGRRSRRPPGVRTEYREAGIPSPGRGSGRAWS